MFSELLEAALKMYDRFSEITNFDPVEGILKIDVTFLF